jgi:hypothetical protein
MDGELPPSVPALGVLAAVLASFGAYLIYSHG